MTTAPGPSLQHHHDHHGADDADDDDAKHDDAKDSDKDDKKDDDAKAANPFLSLLLASKNKDTGTCCYSKTGPSNCEHPRDWCNENEAKCTDCGGTFWTAEQIDDFERRKV